MPGKVTSFRSSLPVTFAVYDEKYTEPYFTVMSRPILVLIFSSMYLIATKFGCMEASLANLRSVHGPELSG